LRGNRTSRTVIGRAFLSENVSLPFGMPAKPPMLSLPLLKEHRLMMPKDMKELLHALNAHAVKYLVIGD
jgi:hypothetical protein